ncbi:hypothetical protein [Actinomadura sp. HBU206391]|uniref:hypothetical protein n=1 Tax=Actinomadura sp. HBU206391 TaxID=2731692 RepID=UPI00164F6F3B|nr:hypothetical protein [Actinomadura sp. HBU206391]MBC6458088.1 hypothetical protein [Actinomadura sp. HBU206391]
MRAIRISPRAVAREAAIVVALGGALAGVSLGLLVLQYGEALRLGFADVLIAGAAGMAAASAVRATARLHRHWKRTVGRFTAAAALCALAALAGALVVMIPGECPGGLFSTGRCGVREAAAWGQVAGLAAVVNFGVAGLTLWFVRLARALSRTVREVIRDGTAQGVIWIKALGGVRRRGSGRRSSNGPRRAGRPASDGRRRDPREPKGRPTPRRTDAERARRRRLRARA